MIAIDAMADVKIDAAKYAAKDVKKDAKKDATTSAKLDVATRNAVNAECAIEILL